MKYSNSPNTYINAQDLEVAIVKATTYGDALNALREVPSINIIRCGKCKYRERCEQIVVFDIGENQLEGRKIDFCSYGEREGE